MQKKKTFMYCETCGEAHEDISPPQKESYEQGRVEIGKHSSILLPESVAEARAIKGYTTNHARDIEGIYCNYECLSLRLKRLVTSNA